MCLDMLGIISIARGAHFIFYILYTCGVDAQRSWVASGVDFAKPKLNLLGLDVDVGNPVDISFL
jgi:hypothetical protein